MESPDQLSELSSPRRRRRWTIRDIAPLVSLTVLVVFFSFAAEDFLGTASLELILKKGAVLAIVAAGLTFVLLCGEIDLSVGMMALWSACACGWFFKYLSTSPRLAAMGPHLTTAAAIVAPLVTCLLLGFLSGLLTVGARLPSFIITLAMMFIAEGQAGYLTQSKTFQVPALLKTLGNRGITCDELLILPYSAMLAAFVMLVGHVVLQHTRFGRYVYMTGGNREAARLAGVRTGWIVVACLALCAAAAGIGGMVNSGRMTGVTMDQNKNLLLSAVACVVLGGTSLFGGEGSMGKTVIGVLTFTVLEVGLMKITWIDNHARKLLTGVVLLTALVINGLLAKERRSR